MNQKLEISYNRIFPQNGSVAAEKGPCLECVSHSNDKKLTHPPKRGRVRWGGALHTKPCKLKQKKTEKKGFGKKKHEHGVFQKMVAIDLATRENHFVKAVGSGFGGFRSSGLVQEPQVSSKRQASTEMYMFAYGSEGDSKWYQMWIR